MFRDLYLLKAISMFYISCRNFSSDQSNVLRVNNAVIWSMLPVFNWTTVVVEKDKVGTF